MEGAGPNSHHGGGRGVPACRQRLYQVTTLGMALPGPGHLPPTTNHRAMATSTSVLSQTQACARHTHTRTLSPPHIPACTHIHSCTRAHLWVHIWAHSRVHATLTYIHTLLHTLAAILVYTHTFIHMLLRILAYSPLIPALSRTHRYTDFHKTLHQKSPGVTATIRRGFKCSVG